MDTEIIEESPRDKVEKKAPTRREAREQERRLKMAACVGIGLFIVVIALVALALIVEPAPKGTDVAVLQPSRVQAPSLPVSAESAPAVAEAVEAVEVESLPAVETKPEVPMPPALAKLVNERMSATDRDRFEKDWAAMKRGDRIEYLRQLGYDVSTL